MLSVQVLKGPDRTRSRGGARRQFGRKEQSASSSRKSNQSNKCGKSGSLAVAVGSRLKAPYERRACSHRHVRRVGFRGDEPKHFSSEHPMKSEKASWLDDLEPPLECETPVWMIEPPSRSSDGVPQSAGRCSDSHPEERPHERPHEPRGWLRNGNRPGDPSRAPRCGARNRRGLPCQCPAMKNGHCRLHGGLSTGARTAEGRKRIRKGSQSRPGSRHGRHASQRITTTETALRNREDEWQPKTGDNSTR
jgi:hypothetical protein